MTILVASDDIRILRLFSAFVPVSKITLAAITRAVFLKNAKDLNGELLFVWYDLAGLEAKEVKAAYRSLAKLPVPWGLIDRKCVLTDASQAFWAGASDYIGARTDLTLIDQARLKKTLAWAASRTLEPKVPVPHTPRPSKLTSILHNPDGSPLKADFIDSSIGWKSIFEGHDYSFTFIYVQIDRSERLLETLGENRLRSLDKEFLYTVEQTFAKNGAQIWMWRDYGGVLLLPFDGRECPAILEALRLWLNRPIIYAANAALSVGFTFRMAIHIGNTTYRRPGNTGELTSDALNSIFHLGARFMKNDTLYLTDAAAPFIPPKIADLFTDAGTYDGRPITRMRSFV